MQCCHIHSFKMLQTWLLRRPTAQFDPDTATALLAFVYVDGGRFMTLTPYCADPCSIFDFATYGGRADFSISAAVAAWTKWRCREDQRKRLQRCIWWGKMGFRPRFSLFFSTLL